MTTQTPDDGRETTSFKIADRKIFNLLKRLRDKHVCGCCTARALTYHAAHLAEQQMGSVKAIEMYEEIIAIMRENDVPAPERMSSTEAH